jgi:hypothetical protein
VSSNLVWAGLCFYLVIAAASILQADFQSSRDGASGALAVCVVALAFAAFWPVRLLRFLLGFAS